jgi:hypothetical protein
LKILSRISGKSTDEVLLKNFGSMIPKDHAIQLVCIGIKSIRIYSYKIQTV